MILLLRTIAGSKLIGTVVSVLAVGLIVFFMILYFQREARQDTLKEAQIEQQQKEIETQKVLVKKERKVRNESTSVSGTDDAVNFLRDRYEARHK